MNAFEKCLWTVFVMYWYRRRDFNTLSRFRYQPYSSSMTALLCPHIHGGCSSWSLLGMQVWGDSTSSWEGSVPPELCIVPPHPAHTADGSQHGLRGLLLLSQNMRDLTRALFLRNHSPIHLPGNGPTSSADVGFFSSWSPFWWRLFWSDYIAEEERVCVIVFMSWGLISLDRLPCLLRFLNQKSVSAGLHKRRGSAEYRRFALHDVCGAQKWYWCDLRIPSPHRKNPCRADGVMKLQTGKMQPVWNGQVLYCQWVFYANLSPLPPPPLLTRFIEWDCTLQFCRPSRFHCPMI